MPEGLLVAGSSAVAGAVHDDPDREPAAGPDAPKGYAWNRKTRSWQARQRGPVKWTGGAVAADPGRGGEPESPAAAEQVTSGVGQQQRDPDPSWLRTDETEANGQGRLPFELVPQEAKDNAASLAGMLGMPLLAFSAALDPVCGGALRDGYEGIVDACLPLVLRSKKAVEFFTSKDSDWLLWLGLGQALWPVATTIAQHHVFHTVAAVKDPNTGRVTIVRGDDAKAVRKGAQGGDHLTPAPQPEFPADAYAA